MTTTEISHAASGGYAPIALFVYSRAAHTRKTIEALAANEGAALSDLYVFSDAPRDPRAVDDVAEVRSLIREITGFNKVTIVERDTNFGLSKSIICGVTQLNNEYGRVIVLEDDLVTSPFFLKYTNEALNLYKDVNEVASISGYMYPINLCSHKPTFFFGAPQSWGWATWQRAWRLFIPDGQQLLQELEQKKAVREFNKNGPYSFKKMLEDQINGRNDSWFIRWYASTFLSGKLHLMPRQSLVKNIGIDGSGVHCANWRYNPFNVNLSDVPISVCVIEVVENEGIKPRIRRYFRKVRVLRYVNFILRLPIIRSLVH